ncbi:MAG: VWA domain-containing protein [Acidobacteriota bacterium]|nr:VWA domain-containing protein [Acidobacteriota bacterium]
MAIRAGSSRFVFSLLIPVLGALTATRAEAQAPPDRVTGPYVARGEVVSVTNLDVVVTDGKGNRVTGLKKEDFIVVEDNLEQVITNFSPIEQGKIFLPVEEAPAAAAPAPPAAAPAPPTVANAPRTRIVIFIDNLHLSPGDRNRVLRNVETFVRDSVRDNVEAMIVVWNRSLKIRRKFTNDGRDLSDVLKQIEEESAFGQQILSDRRDVIQGIDDSTTASQASGRVRSYCQSLDNDLTFTIDAIKTTINQLAGVDGRKILLHVSSGLPQSPGAELWQYVSDKYRDAGMQTMQSFEFDRTTKYLGVIQAANSSGVSIYALDASGLTVDSGVSAETRTTSQRIDTFLERNNLQSMLSLMSEETGGEAILNKNDVLVALKGIEKDYTSYYSIGYRSVRTGLDRPHKVEVKLKKKGFTVRARRSYVEKGVETQVREAVTSALFFPRDDNPLAVGLEVGKPVPADRENFAVPVIIRIPYARLAMLPEGTKVRGRVVFYFVVIDSAGKQSELTTQPVPIDLDAKKFEALHQKDFVYDVKLIMIPGGQKLSIAVRDDVTNSTSYLQKSVFVSAFAGEEAAPRK